MLIGHLRVCKSANCQERHRSESRFGWRSRKRSIDKVQDVCVWTGSAMSNKAALGVVYIMLLVTLQTLCFIKSYSNTSVPLVG